MTLSGTGYPEDIPAELIAALEDSSERELRDIIEYAHQLLRDRPSITDAIESRHGEELVRIAEYGAYTIVVVERSNGTDEARGPFAYRVKWEPHIDDEGGRYRWHYLGKVYGDRRRFG